MTNDELNVLISKLSKSAYSEIDRIIDEINNPDVKILATGGLSGVIIPLCKHKIERIENLTLYGLLEIYNKNK